MQIKLGIACWVLSGVLWAQPHTHPIKEAFDALVRAAPEIPLDSEDAQKLITRTQDEIGRLILRQIWDENGEKFDPYASKEILNFLNSHLNDEVRSPSLRKKTGQFAVFYHKK